MPPEATEMLVASLHPLLGTVQSILSWGVVLALGAAWGGLRDAKNIEMAGLKLERRDAFFIGALLYVAANIAILLSLLRIEAVLYEINDANFVRAYLTLAAHEWPLNPFGYLGTSFMARLSTSWGPGLVILSWWICATSVLTLRGRLLFWKSLLVIVPLYGVGLMSLWAIWRIYVLNLERLARIAPSLHDGIRATAGTRWHIIIGSIVVGMVLVVATVVLQHVQYRKTLTTTLSPSTP